MSSPTRTRRFRGLGFRLTVWSAAVLCAAVLGTGWFLYLRLQTGLHKQNDEFLELWSKDFTSLVTRNPGNAEKIKSELQRETDLSDQTSVVCRLLRPDGEEVFRSKEFPKHDRDIGTIIADARKAKGPVEAWAVQGESGYPYRMTAEPVWSGGEIKYVVETGYYLKRTERTLHNYRMNLLRVLVPLVVIGIVGGWLLARKSLAPIANMTSTAQAISRESLQKRIPVRGSGDELDRLAEVLNEMLDRIQESFERTERFSSDLAHELKTPLTVLKGEVEAALIGNRSADELRTIIAEQAETYDRLNGMIADLLLLSRKAAEAARPQSRPADVRDCAHEAVDTFAPLAEEAQVELSASYADRPCEVQGDKSSLCRVFSNLLDNAIKHTPAGGRVSVDVRAGEKCTITVRDTGRGIEPEDLPHVFERFYRGDRARSRETGGSGLGLSICKQIVENHRGSISIRSQPGRGTDVTIELPLAAEHGGPGA